jgi:hypothetical protein
MLKMFLMTEKKNYRMKKMNKIKVLKIELDREALPYVIESQEKLGCSYEYGTSPDNAVIQVDVDGNVSIDTSNGEYSRMKIGKLVK